MHVPTEDLSEYWLKCWICVLFRKRITIHPIDTCRHFYTLLYYVSFLRRTSSLSEKTLLHTIFWTAVRMRGKLVRRGVVDEVAVPSKSHVPKQYEIGTKQQQSVARPKVTAK